MTAVTLTLTDFLLARIAEDEAIARSNTDHFEYPRWDLWSVERREDRALLMRQAPPAGRRTVRLVVNHHDITLLDQLARWDPDRVLAECEAKRQIVAEFVARDQDTALMLGPDSLRQREWSGLRLAMRLLALPYADHPDYRQEWTPTP